MIRKESGLGSIANVRQTRDESNWYGQTCYRCDDIVSGSSLLHDCTQPNSVRRIKELSDSLRATVSGAVVTGMAPSSRFVAFLTSGTPIGF